MPFECIHYSITLFIFEYVHKIIPDPPLVISPPLCIHKARILRKKPLEKTFLDFKKWVKNIQTAGYNGARTVDDLLVLKHYFLKVRIIFKTTLFSLCNFLPYLGYCELYVCPSACAKPFSTWKIYNYYG